MEQIRLSTLKQHLHKIIDSVNRSNKPILITDGEKLLVKIVPASPPAPMSWLGCMQNTGRILDDIVAPVAETDMWEVLSG